MANIVWDITRDEYVITAGEETRLETYAIPASHYEVAQRIIETGNTKVRIPRIEKDENLEPSEFTSAEDFHKARKNADDKVRAFHEAMETLRKAPKSKLLKDAKALNITVE